MILVIHCFEESLTLKEMFWLSIELLMIWGKVSTLTVIKVHSRVQFNGSMQFWRYIKAESINT